MPKIPLYNQGLGQTVTTKPIQGVRANEGAFTASQKGFSAFGGAIEDAAFKFGMEEKKAETDRYRNKVNTDVNQEMNNFTMNSEATTVAEYQALADKKRIELRNKHLSGLEGKLTKNQFRDVSMQFDNTFAAKVATGSQQAHNKHQAIRTEQVNTTVDDTLSQLRSLDPSSQLYQDIQTGLDEGFDRWASQGISPKYSKTTYRKELSNSRYVNDINSVNSQDGINKMREQLDRDKPNMKAAEYAARNAGILAKEKIVDAEEVNTAHAYIIENIEDFTDEQFDKAIEDIRNGKTVSLETVASMEAGEGEKTISFSTMKSTNRGSLISMLTQSRKSDEGETISANLNLLDQSIQNMSLADLKKMENDTYEEKNGSFVLYPDIKKRSGRQAMRASINAEINERAKRAVANSLVVIDRVKSQVIAADGQVTPEMTAQIGNAAKTFRLAEMYSEADALELEFAATAEASRQFKRIEFASAEQTAAALKEAGKKENIATPEGAKVFSMLKKRIIERDKLQEDNFVGYYMSKNTEVDQTSENFVTDMITMQTKMGVAPSKIRVTTNAQLDVFVSQFEAADPKDKGGLMDAFLNKFGTENENRVMRHLMETNKISKVDNVVAAYPNNANINMVAATGTKEGQKTIKDFNSTDDIKQINEATDIIMQNYGASNVGNFIDDTRGGGTIDRVNHNLGIKTIVRDTAAYIRASANGTTTHQKAVEMAYNTVIGNNFVFPTINKTVIRLPKNLSGVQKDIKVVLESSLSLNRERLSDAIDYPPAPSGTTQEIANEQYLNDLEAEGTWRTTQSGTGAYLVDQTGNLVPKSDGSGFVTVTFDQVLEYAEGIPDNQKGDGGFAKTFRTKYFATKGFF